MTVWGVVRAGGALPGPGSRLQAWLDGCVTEDSAGLIAALGRVPEAVDVVALLDAASVDADEPADLACLSQRLGGGADAVVRGDPVTDALKRVEGATVRDEVDRAGLYVPGLPQLWRREVLERAVEGGAEPLAGLDAAEAVLEVVRSPAPLPSTEGPAQRAHG